MEDLSNHNISPKEARALTPLNVPRTNKGWADIQAVNPDLDVYKVHQFYVVVDPNDNTCATEIYDGNGTYYGGCRFDRSLNN